MTLKSNFYRFIFISVLGVLLHFTYDLFDQNKFIALFSATNESTFEHLKLIFFPMILLTIIEFTFLRDKLPTNYLSARTKGIICGMLFIITTFYTIHGVLGKNYDFINIAIYFAGVIFALFIENKLYKKSCLTYSNAITILLVLTILFFIFTFYPPNIGLFNHPK